MERLTKRKYGEIVSKEKDDGQIHCSSFCNSCSRGTGDCNYVKEMVEKLAEYEDLEEQGLLMKLPCKIGDTIWDNDFRKPCSYIITGISLGTGEGYIDEPVSTTKIVYYYSNPTGSITGSFASSEIGKTIFFTREEAEEALKKAGGENE